MFKNDLIAGPIHSFYDFFESVFDNKFDKFWNVGYEFINQILKT